MLLRLLIRNFALIGELELTVGPGLTVITGETGAGKSILLDAIGLLLGDYADPASFRDSTLRCVVEMEFLSHDPEVLALWSQINNEEPHSANFEFILRREISPQRRSRCLINDRVSTLKELKNLATLLLDLSGQEEAVAVDKRQTQVLLLDQIACCEDIRREYAASFTEWVQTRQALDGFLTEYEKSQREEDLNRFHYEELRSAPLENWARLIDCENQLSIQENALDSREKLTIAAASLVGDAPNGGQAIADQLRDLLQQLAGISGKDSEVAAWTESLKSVLLQIRELARDAESMAEARVPDLQMTQQLRDQVDVLQSLLHKHRLFELQDLRDLREKLASFLETGQGVDERRKTLEAQEARALEQCRLAALRLHLVRTKGLSDLSNRLAVKLAKLSMEHARLVLDWNTIVSNLNEQSTADALQEWVPTEALMGLDRPDLLFSANPGQDPRPLGQVASGGEKSRLLLALKSLVKEQGRDHTRIFDEIDTGISGETALRMGQMLSEMAKNQQIILITHLPQIAALGDHHWHVTKEVENQQTRTALSVLGLDQRQETLARMIGGDRYGKAALQQALVLLHTSHLSQ
ncbi:MAG: hypothetical protein FJ350_04530 [Sphingomonadales bacterium]|nr:hypothetical protein [Sphingomonadales bacterium]